MLHTQKKVLQHVSDSLKSFDISLLYSVIVDSLNKAGVEDKLRGKITDEIYDAIYAEVKKVNLAKDWVDTIIKDI